MPRSSKVSSSSKTKISSKSTAIPKIVENFKSAEFVEDSADEDERKHLRTPHKPLKNSTVIESKPIPTRTKPKVRPTSVNSISTIPNGKTSKQQKRDGRSSQITTSSDSQSGTEEETAKNIGVVEDSEDEESSEGSSTGSESETDTTSGNDAGKVIPQSKKAAPTIPQKQAASQNPVAQYEPPSGFGPATITIPTSSRLADLFSSESLRTKQLLHITAPSAVPLDLIGGVSTESLKSGSSILTHEGADYGLITGVQDQNAKKILLLPFAEANDYKSSEVRISKTLNLQRIIPDRRHGQSTISTGADRTNQSRNYEKPVRQQPKGLKMRYRPFGDTEDSSEQSGFESSPKPSKRALQFRKPISLGTSSSKKNKERGETNIEGVGDTESTMKKKGRDWRADSLDVAGASHTELQKDRTANSKVSKKRKNHVESERGGTERPAKKMKSEVALEPVPEGRSSPYSSNAIPPRAFKASKESRVKKNVNIERTDIRTPAKSQKHVVPSETVAVHKIPLLNEKLDRTSKPIGTEPSEEEISRNEYPEDTIMLDPPPTISLKIKNEDASHNGKHLKSQPTGLIVRNETKQDDKVIVEPIKEKQGSKKEKRRRERPEGSEKTPTGEATRATANAAKEATITMPAAETLTDAPTTAINTENSMTAEELISQGRKDRKERKRHKHVEGSNNIIHASKDTRPLRTTSVSTPAGSLGQLDKYARYFNARQ
ncbi:hypothetical protein MMC07_003819 [Pseudocyphellaria aurata]|nr:hypothetical protein [Pseudocyphellaria aurata]